MPITISIVEDNDKLRATLAKVIGRAEGFRFVSDYPSAEDALADLPKVKPEVVLMDINLPGMNGVECVRKLKALMPQTQVMMLTVYEDTENIFNALAAGANGYMLKRTPTKELIEAIREVHVGKMRIPAEIAGKLAERLSGQQLTTRELGVLERIVSGRSNKQIASDLGVSEATVKTHVNSLLGKLGVEDRTQAATAALQRGLVHLGSQ